MTKHAHIAIAIGLAMVGLLGLSMHLGRRPEPVVVKLVAGPPQPRVPPGEAGMDPVALQAAVDFAGARRSSALIVSRGGHIVFEKYWSGTTAETPVAPGFDPALVALAVGSALDDRSIGSLDAPVSNYIRDAGAPEGAMTLRELLAGDHAALSIEQATDLVASVLERVTQQPYEKFVVERLWKPLGGGDLEFQRKASKRRPQGVSAACCVRVRVGDWMRVGELLANQGSFEDSQLTPPRYVNLMLQPAHKESPRGYFTRVDGAFAAHDVAWLEGSDKQRLWIVPSLKLAILRLGDAPSSVRRVGRGDDSRQHHSGYERLAAGLTQIPLARPIRVCTRHTSGVGEAEPQPSARRILSINAVSPASAPSASMSSPAVATRVLRSSGLSEFFASASSMSIPAAEIAPSTWGSWV